jgi:nucleotide-binding universal stress UspA family protein
MAYSRTPGDDAVRRAAGSGCSRQDRSADAADRGDYCQGVVGITQLDSQLTKGAHHASRTPHLRRGRRVTGQCARAAPGGRARPPPRCRADPRAGLAAARQPPTALPELRHIWHDDAWQRLWDTLDAAFGGLPDGITTQPAVLCGKPGKVLTGVARQDGDVLVIGTGRRGRLRRMGAAGSAVTAWPTSAARC